MTWLLKRRESQPISISRWCCCLHDWSQLHTSRLCLCHYLPFKSSISLLNNGSRSLASGMDDSNGLLVGQSTVLLQMCTKQRHIGMTATPTMTYIKTLLLRTSNMWTRHQSTCTTSVTSATTVPKLLLIFELHLLTSSFAAVIIMMTIRETSIVDL